MSCQVTFFKAKTERQPVFSSSSQANTRARARYVQQSSATLKITSCKPYSMTKAN